MGLLEKKSIKIDGVLDFEWCPDRELGASKENMFAYWTPEAANQPARVTLMAIPSRNVLRSKNLFNVNDVSRPCSPRRSSPSKHADTSLSMWT